MTSASSLSHGPVFSFHCPGLSSKPGQHISLRMWPQGAQMAELLFGL
jgi:hypothetical protein